MPLATDPWIGADPRELMPGLGPLAEVFGLKLTGRPFDKQLQRMLRVWGSYEGLKRNAPTLTGALQLFPDRAIAPELLQNIQATELLSRFPLRCLKGARSGPGRPKGEVAVLIIGDRPDRTEKRVRELRHHVMHGMIRPALVILLAADRPTTKDTERGVVGADELLHTVRELTGRRIAVVTGSNREVQLGKLFQGRRRSLAKIDIYLPNCAPVALSEALKFRRIVRKLHPSFDDSGEQLWTSQQNLSEENRNLRLARTHRQAGNTRRYVAPEEIFPALARAARELYLLNREVS